MNEERRKDDGSAYYLFISTLESVLLIGRTNHDVRLETVDILCQQLKNVEIVGTVERATTVVRELKKKHNSKFWNYYSFIRLILLEKLT